MLIACPVLLDPLWCWRALAGQVLAGVAGVAGAIGYLGGQGGVLGQIAGLLAGTNTTSRESAAETSKTLGIFK